MSKFNPHPVAKKIKSHHDFMWSYFIDMVRAMFRPAMFFLVGLSLTAILLFASVFYWLESETNSTVPTFFEAVYFTLTTLTTVGYGDVTPVTRGGRLLAMFMMIFGTGLFASFTAVISSTIIGLEQSRTPKS